MQELPSTASDGGCDAFTRDPRIVLAGNLLAAAHRLRRILDVRLEASSGLELAFYEVMVRLRRSPNQRLTMGELASEIALSTGGVTRLVDRLETDGLLYRVHCPSDRRTTYVELSALGNERLEAATEDYLRLLDELLIAPLEGYDTNRLARALGELGTPNGC
ncbi:MAG: MarR family transcriptional regulator [Actinomycetota bacterium]